MAKKLVMDKVLFAVILLMLSFGAVMVYSASAVLSMALVGHFFKMQNFKGLTLFIKMIFSAFLFTKLPSMIFMTSFISPTILK